MDGHGEYHAKWNKPVRERQVSHDFTYVWHLINKINKWIKSFLKAVVCNRIIHNQKKGNLFLCDCMDGPGEYCAKWNKPVRERQVPYDFTYVWNL